MLMKRKILLVLFITIGSAFALLLFIFSYTPTFLKALLVSEKNVFSFANQRNYITRALNYKLKEEFIARNVKYINAHVSDDYSKMVLARKIIRSLFLNQTNVKPLGYSNIGSGRPPYPRLIWGAEACDGENELYAELLKGLFPADQVYLWATRNKKGVSKHTVAKVINQKGSAIYADAFPDDSYATIFNVDNKQGNINAILQHGIHKSGESTILKQVYRYTNGYPMLAVKSHLIGRFLPTLDVSFTVRPESLSFKKAFMVARLNHVDGKFNEALRYYQYVAAGCDAKYAYCRTSKFWLNHQKRMSLIKT